MLFILPITLFPNSQKTAREHSYYAQEATYYFFKNSDIQQFSKPSSCQFAGFAHSTKGGLLPLLGELLSNPRTSTDN